MTPVEANQAIVLRFMSEWPTLSGGVPYSTDNNTMQSASRFAVLRIASLGSEQLSMGPPGFRKFLHEGAIDVLLVGPPDEGRGPLDVLAGFVRDIFQTVRIGKTGSEPGIWTEATGVGEQRKHPEFPDSWVLVASTPFQYLEVR